MEIILEIVNRRISLKILLSEVHGYEKINLTVGRQGVEKKSLR